MTKTKYRDFDLIYEQGIDLIGFYRNHPCIAAYDLLGADLAPIQRLVFRDMWFKSYFIGVMGRGAGKCVDVNSLTYFKDIGLVYLNEVLPKIPNYLNNGGEEVVDYCNEIYTSEGFKSTKKLVFEKKINGKKIVTQNGFVNRGSCRHPLLTIDKNGELVYKKLEDFNKGDYVCIQRGQGVWGKNDLDKDDAYLIGLFVGGGLIDDKYYYQSITTNDEYILSFCKNYCEKNKILYRIDKDKRTENTYSFVFKQFGWFFKKYRISRVKSYYKTIPYSIRTSNKESQVAFLQGYFDTDGTADSKRGYTSCCSVSKKLLKEVQIILLNFGIISRIRVKKTKSFFGKAYILDIGSKDSKLFSDEIGFRLKRKQDILDNYFNVKFLNPNKDVIPYAKEICRQIVLDYRNINSSMSNGRDVFRLPVKNNCKEFTYNRLSSFIEEVDDVVAGDYVLSYKSLENIYNLKKLLNYNYFYDKIVLVEDWVGDCYDFEMDMEDAVEPNYFANGFINHNTYMLGVLAALSCMLYPGYRVGLISSVFRQSKMIFSEVEKLYSKSSFLREACEKKPIRGTDTWYLRFKSIGGYSGSFIEALPLGDGSKIRGSRFYLILLDELAQIPDSAIDLVIRPMGATQLEPMENVRRIERQKKLLELGLITEDELEEDTINKMVMTSSGYYKFNHMWRRMKDYWRQMEIEGEKSRCVVWQVPYTDLPEGFLDKTNIEEAQRVMTTNEFRMEYEADMISDSDGFFSASLLETCTIDSDVNIELKGDPKSQYVVGIDPNQGGSASCGVVIIRLGSLKKIVNVIELKGKTTQDMTIAIQEICNNYNIIRIFMDKGGGGKAIMDLLDEGYNNSVPIIDRTDADKVGKEGRHILEMVNFNPEWISDANFTTKAMLEDKVLLFPEAPTQVQDIYAKVFDNFKKLKSQMLSIVVTQTATGKLHFDTPKKGQNKDLYSAIILAANGVRMIEKELEIEPDPVLYNESGMIRLRNAPRDSWDTLGNNGQVVVNDRRLDMAVLTKKK